MKPFFLKKTNNRTVDGKLFYYIQQKNFYKYLVVMVGEYIITTDRPLRTRYGQRCATWWCNCGIRKWSNHSLAMISYMNQTWIPPSQNVKKKQKLAFYFLPSEKKCNFSILWCLHSSYPDVTTHSYNYMKKKLID